MVWIECLGSGPVLQRNPIFFEFSGGGRTLSPPLDPRMNPTQHLKQVRILANMESQPQNTE